MLNKCQFIGYVGKAPEGQRLQNGDWVCRINLATTEKWKDKDGTKKEKTTWVQVIFWRALAEIVTKYVDKGSRIYVEGKLEIRAWEDKDGITRNTPEIIASNILLLDTQKSGGAPQLPGLDNTATSDDKPEPSDEADPNDDLPF